MTVRPVKDDLRDVARAIAWVGEILDAAGLHADIRFAVDLGLEEALANLIMHGVCPCGEKDICVDVSASQEEALVIITDACEPFDVTDPANETEPEGWDPGGRGLRLLRAAVSDLAYATTDGRNVLTLRFAKSLAQVA
jgi:anti-sigma regulatory factor (Ser/Thr protein kinase)